MPHETGSGSASAASRTAPREALANAPIALALSGGGFRATLFHLGVIRYLRAAGLLQNVRHIAAVSGGSILAAHVALHWNRYCGTVGEFDAASNEILRFCTNDVRGKIVRRLPLLTLARLLPGRFRLPRTTTDLLQRHLRRLYRDANFADLETMQPAAPRLSIVATNLSNPGLTLFEAGRLWFLPLREDDQHPARNYTAAPSLALAVAASAAYPAFFTPVAVRHDEVLVDDEYGVQSHTDGGVIDNQGLEALLDGDPDASTWTVISDASETSGARPETRFGLLDSGFRATELMMAQIREQRYVELTERGGSAVLIHIESTGNHERAAEPVVQSQLAGLRTDLDAFDAVETTELVRHGFWVAQTQFGTAYNPKFEPPAAKMNEPSRIAKHLQKGAALRLGIFAWRDPIWLCYAVIAALLLALIGPYANRLLHKMKDLAVYVQSYEALHRELIPVPKGEPAIIERIDGKVTASENRGFKVMREDRVWDLRSLHVAQDQNTVAGPGFMTRYTNVIREKPGATIYSYRFETTGRDIRVWLNDPTGKLRLRLKGELQPTPRPNGGSLVRAFVGEIDCSQIDVGTPFVIAVTAEYVDAFRSRDQWWVAMRITNPLETASMRIIFPRALPFANPSFRRHPNDTHLVGETLAGALLQLDGPEPELFWTIANPKTNFTYRVNWDWFPRSQS